MATTHVPTVDRYVAAVLAHVPRDQRAGVEVELRRSIAADTARRLAAGQDPDEAAAEREVLTGLGDPIRAAADYSGRPLALIGPAFYPDYLRLLRLLLLIVVPVVAIVIGATTVLAGSGPWQVLLAAAGAAFSVGVQVAFWVTLVFALLDRSGSAPRKEASWDLDDLPELPVTRVGLGETVASVAGLALLAWFLVWQPEYRETLDSTQPPIPILDPDLSGFWIPLLVTVLLASIALAIVVYRRGRWTPLLAGVNTVLTLTFALPAIWLLATGRALNPAFTTDAALGALGDVAELLPTLIAWLIALIAAWDVADSWRRALRSG